MGRYLIGIDDTDNKTSRGTGFLSRRMAGLIIDKKLGEIKGISRHQLFVHPLIPYTSQNSSACLDVFTDNAGDLVDFCRDFLKNESAVGSDAGLAFAPFNSKNSKLVDWGIRAKKEVLTQNEAMMLAEKEGTILEGLTGTRDGIIGALAGIGLRMSGDDGRFIWLSGIEIRDLKGPIAVRELLDKINVDQVIGQSGEILPDEEILELGEWVRPILLDNKITIIAEKSLNMPEYEWKVANKEYIKSITG